MIFDALSWASQSDLDAAGNVLVKLVPAGIWASWASVHQQFSFWKGLVYFACKTVHL